MAAPWPTSPAGRHVVTSDCELGVYTPKVESPYGLSTLPLAALLQRPGAPVEAEADDFDVLPPEPTP